jgi:hypothetical protein
MRSARIDAALCPIADADLSSAGLHLPADIGKDMREPDMPEEGHQSQRRIP